MAERMLPLELAVAAVVFAILISRRSPDDTIESARAVPFVAALGVLAIALIGPIDAGSARELSWHMVQHLLIVSVAAPLLALARPLELIFDSMPRRWRLRHRRRWGSAATIVTGFAALSTLFVWHIPTLYESALSSETIHIAEHVTLLATSSMLWSALIRTRHSGAGVVWLFILTLPVTAFGVAMTLARTPWYTHYVTTSRASALQDQQLAGVIMWAFGGLAALAGGVILFAAWLVNAAPTAESVSLVGSIESSPTW